MLLLGTVGGVMGQDSQQLVDGMRPVGGELRLVPFIFEICNRQVLMCLQWFPALKGIALGERFRSQNAWYLNW